MKQNLPLKSLLLAAAFSLGLATAASADDSIVVTDPSELDATGQIGGDLSLLGQSHATLTYGYNDLDGTSTSADRYAFEWNQPLSAGFDAVLSYDYLQSGLFGSARVKQHTLAASLRAFSTAYSWGRPYLEAGAGYVWERFAGARDDSWLWGVGAGVEFQVHRRATVTPFVEYTDAPDLAREGVWNYGVKGSYWLDRNWALTAGFSRDDEQNSEFTVGTNFRF